MMPPPSSRLRSRKPPASMASPGAGFPAPGPVLHAVLVKWVAGREIHRVHSEKYGSAEFNPLATGNARFSPIARAKGKIIPTLYGGSTFECTAMETVFHDIPYNPGFKTFDKDKLAGKWVSVISPVRDLQLVDLSNTALRKLGVSRLQLIDSDAADYPHTRPWAVALHDQLPKADGLLWMSRQDDEARALVLFGDRVKKADLAKVEPPTDIVNDPVRYGRILDLAQRIGVNIV